MRPTGVKSLLKAYTSAVFFKACSIPVPFTVVVKFIERMPSMKGEAWNIAASPLAEYSSITPGGI